MRSPPSRNGAIGRASLSLPDRAALRRLLDGAAAEGHRLARESFLASFEVHLGAFMDSLGPGTREAIARQLPEYLGGSYRRGDRTEGPQ
jgi:hypothetical protein